MIMRMNDFHVYLSIVCRLKIMLLLILDLSVFLMDLNDSMVHAHQQLARICYKYVPNPLQF